MNKQPNSKPNLDVRALRKEAREKTEKENIKIFNEFGISTKQLLAEMKVEMDKITQILRFSGRVKGKLNYVFDYETNINELIESIDYGWRNSLEIQTIFKRLKSEFDAFTNPK